MNKPINYPNGAESFAAAAAVLQELIPYYHGSAISERDMFYTTMEFETLMSFNYRPKLKPHCEVWEERIVSFAEHAAWRLKYEAENNIKKIVYYTDTKNA